MFGVIFNIRIIIDWANCSEREVMELSICSVRPLCLTDTIRLTKWLCECLRIVCTPWTKTKWRRYKSCRIRWMRLSEFRRVSLMMWNSIFLRLWLQSYVLSYLLLLDLVCVVFSIFVSLFLVSYMNSNSFCILDFFLYYWWFFSYILVWVA